MDERNDSRLDKILSDIEFPGETGEGIPRYLEQTRFTDEVMKKANRHRTKANRALAWGIVTVFDLVVLSILGTNGSFVREYLSIYTDLTYIFFLFLSLSLLGGLCGLILNIDTSWMKTFDSRDLDGYVKNLPKRIAARFFK